MEYRLAFTQGIAARKSLTEYLCDNSILSFSQNLHSIPELIGMPPPNSFSKRSMFPRCTHLSKRSSHSTPPAAPRVSFLTQVMAYHTQYQSMKASRCQTVYSELTLREEM